MPVATVYRLFSAKLGILKALLDISIAGDDQPVAMPDRPQVIALDARGDPAQLLADLAAITVGINTRSGDVYRILTIAAGADQRPPSCSVTTSASAPGVRAAWPASWPGQARCAPGCASAMPAT